LSSVAGKPDRARDVPLRHRGDWTAALHIALRQRSRRHLAPRIGALGDDLLPTTEDAQAFIDDQAYTFARVMVEEVPPLLERAERKRGQIVKGVIGDGIRVRLFRDPDDEAPLLTVAISSRPLPGVVTLVPQWQARLVLKTFSSAHGRRR